MPVPVGETFTIESENGNTSYHVKPNLFSDDVMGRLASYLKSEQSRARKEAIAFIKEAGLEGDTLKAAMSEIFADWISKPTIGYESCIEALQSADGSGVAIALECLCDNIGNQQEARKVMQNHPNVVELMTKIIEAGAEALEMAEKNSDLLNPKAKEVKAA